jgi:hypothetical protein
MQKVCVQKGVTYKLPQMPPAWSEHKWLCPVAHGHSDKIAGSRAKMWTIGENENKYVNGDEDVICVGCPTRPNACPDGQYHTIIFNKELTHLVHSEAYCNSKQHVGQDIKK